MVAVVHLFEAMAQTELERRVLKVLVARMVQEALVHVGLLEVKKVAQEAIAILEFAELVALQVLRQQFILLN